MLAVTIGIYLPLELEVPIFIGGLLGAVVRRMQQKRQLKAAAVAAADRGGLLFASGLITGEALAGILLAVPIVAAGNPDILALMEEPSGVGLIAGILLLGSVALWLCRIAAGKRVQ
jgi:uncharacterized oligopeptide transporter (OPT) family protein